MDGGGYAFSGDFLFSGDAAEPQPKSSEPENKMEQIAVYVGEHPLLTPRQKEVLAWLWTEGPDGFGELAQTVAGRSPARWKS